MIFVLWVFLVTEWRTGTVFPFAPFHLEHIPDLPGAITKVNFIHGKLKRSHDIFKFGVKIIRNGNIVNLMFREKLLCIVAGFSHVTAKTGKVFSNDHVCFAGFKGTHHCLKAWTLEITTRPAVIDKGIKKRNAISGTVVSHYFFLIKDTGGLPFVGFFLG